MVRYIALIPTYLSIVRIHSVLSQPAATGAILYRLSLRLVAPPASGTYSLGIETHSDRATVHIRVPYPNTYVSSFPLQNLRSSLAMASALTEQKVKDAAVNVQVNAEDRTRAERQLSAWNMKDDAISATDGRCI